MVKFASLKLYTVRTKQPVVHPLPPPLSPLSFFEKWDSYSSYLTQILGVSVVSVVFCEWCESKVLQSSIYPGTEVSRSGNGVFKWGSLWVPQKSWEVGRPTGWNERRRPKCWSELSTGTFPHMDSSHEIWLWISCGRRAELVHGVCVLVLLSDLISHSGFIMKGDIKKQTALTLEQGDVVCLVFLHKKSQSFSITVVSPGLSPPHSLLSHHTSEPHQQQQPTDRTSRDLWPVTKSLTWCLVVQRETSRNS